MCETASLFLSLCSHSSPSTSLKAFKGFGCGSVGQYNQLVRLFTKQNLLSVALVFKGFGGLYDCKFMAAFSTVLEAISF